MKYLRWISLNAWIEKEKLNGRDSEELTEENYLREVPPYRSRIDPNSGICRALF